MSSAISNAKLGDGALVSTTARCGGAADGGIGGCCWYRDACASFGISVAGDAACTVPVRQFYFPTVQSGCPYGYDNHLAEPTVIAMELMHVFCSLLALPG